MLKTTTKQQQQKISSIKSFQKKHDFLLAKTFLILFQRLNLFSFPKRKKKQSIE